jgi:hypothetical protein
MKFSQCENFHIDTPFQMLTPGLLVLLHLNIPSYSRSLSHKHCSFKYVQERHVNRRA